MSTSSASALDLVIEIKNSTDKITITNQFETPEVNIAGVQVSADQGIEEIQFADGTIYEVGDIAAATGLGTVGDDMLIGTGTADELEGLQGTDLLQGGDGGDTYYFGRGYGADTIQDIMTNPLLSAGDALIMLAASRPWRWAAAPPLLLDWRRAWLVARHLGPNRMSCEHRAGQSHAGHQCRERQHNRPDRVGEKAERKPAVRHQVHHIKRES